MEQDPRKYVDESWKETAEKQKEQLKKAATGKQNPQARPEAPAQEEPPAHEPPVYEPDELPAEEPPAHQHPHEEEAQSIEINFLNYITSLAFQAMVFLGEIPHPATNQPEKNLTQAKVLIDTLTLLREKTIGNLTAKEENMLNATVYELQVKYVEISKKDAVNK